MDVVGLIAAAGGVARRRHLLAAGATDKQILSAVASGRVLRPHRGSYALADAAPSVVWARRMNGQLTCVSAMRALELPTIGRPIGLHLAVHEHRGFAQGDPRLRDGLRFHRVRGARDLRPIAPVPTALDHLGVCVSPLAQLLSIDAALRLGLLTHRDIWSFTATNARRIAWLARMADAGAESLLETIARVHLVMAGFTVSVQHRFAQVGRVDLLVNGRIVVELNGYEPHSTREAFSEDRRRDRLLTKQSIPHLRYTHAEVINRPEQIVADVRAILTH